MGQEIKIFIEFTLTGDLETFEGIVRDILALSDSSMRYDFFRDPGEPARIFALETHRDADALGAHFERAFPLLQKAWACARPVQTLILGDLPHSLADRMKEEGVTVVPPWCKSGGSAS